MKMLTRSMGDFLRANLLQILKVFDCMFVQVYLLFNEIGAFHFSYPCTESLRDNLSSWLLVAQK